MSGRLMAPLMVIGAVLALAVSCGGSEKQADEPTNGGDEGALDGEGGGDDLVPEEKYDEIKRLFERKTTVIGRCFGKAMDSGEVKKEDKIIITVSTTIQPSGKAQNTRIEKTTTTSKTFKDCVVNYVESWDFPTVPEPVEFSHVYRFEEF